MVVEAQGSDDWCLNRFLHCSHGVFLMGRRPTWWWWRSSSQLLLEYIWDPPARRAPLDEDEMCGKNRGNQLKRPFSFLENGKFQTVQKSITWKSSLPSRKLPDFTSCMRSAQMCHAILACMVNTAKIKHPHLTLPFTSATKCYLRKMKHTILHQATKMPSCLEDSNKFSNNSVVPLYPKRHDFKMFPFLILIHLDMCWWFQPNWKNGAWRQYLFETTTYAVSCHCWHIRSHHLSVFPK